MFQSILQRIHLKLIILLVFGQSILFAQVKEGLTGVGGMPLSESVFISSKKKTDVTLTLPFKDDFSYNLVHPDSNLWQDEFVYTNNHMAIDPITKGVATFDGLNANGRAYDITKLSTDTADILTSQFFDLSATADSVIFSFFYQRGGLGESPSSDDSLSVRFFNPTTQTWNSVWREFGNGETSDFELVQIPITNADYLQNGFQFRFISFGSLAGGFDQWHIDYVQLKDNAGLADSTFTDPSMIIQAPSVIRNYDAMPWFHYISAPSPDVFHQDNFDLKYRRNVKIGEAIALILGNTSIQYNGNAPITDIGNPSLDDFHTVSDQVYPYVDALSTYQLTPTPIDEFEYKVIFTFLGSGGTGSDAANDTIERRQVFKNYYSYDDGTAERAYIVTDNPGGFIMTRTVLQNISQEDSLKGIYLYFSSANEDVTQNKFTIVVYADNGGVPGSLIYESDSIYTPIFTDNNFYLPYVLDETVFIQQSAFIGVRQQNANPLTIGFDRNYASRTPLFYGTDGNNYQSFLEGNLMLRPFFRYIPRDISVIENEISEVDFDLYPNPNTGAFKVNLPISESNEVFTYQLLNVSGQLIQSGTITNDNTVIIEKAIPGVYILQLNSSNPSLKPGFKKLIINR